MVSEQRAVLLWLIGSALLFAGVRIVSAADRSIIGATDFRYYSALVLASVLLIVGGFLWISVGGAIGQELR